MSRDRLFPDWLSSVHPNKKIPLRAIWFQTLVAVIFVTIGSFYQILLYSGFVLIFFSTLTVSALFKTSNYRFLPIIFITVNVAVLLNASFSNPWEALAGLITVMAGIPVYLYYSRSRP
jgi:APA family basic amino acid/polyamine antiporter